MEIDKDPEMESDNAGVPEELEKRSNKQEETNQSGTNGSVQPCDSSGLGSSPYPKEGPFVHEISHEQPTPVEEPQDPQPEEKGLPKQGNVLKYPVKAIQFKLENNSGFPAKTYHLTPADSPNFSEKPSSSKRITIPNFSEKLITFQQTDTNTSAKPTPLKFVDTSKSSAKPFLFKLPGAPKFSEKTVSFQQTDAPNTSTKPNPLKLAGTSKFSAIPTSPKLADILKSAKPASPKQVNTFSSPEKKILLKQPDIPSSSAKPGPSQISPKHTLPTILGNLFSAANQLSPKPSSIPESSEETMASKQNESPNYLGKTPTQGDIVKVAEDAKQGSLSTSSEAAMPSKKGDTSQPSSNAPSPKQRDRLQAFTKPIIPKQGNISMSSEDAFKPKHGDIPKVLAKPSMPKPSEKTISSKPADLLKAYTKPMVPKKQGNIPKSEEAFLPKLGDSAKNSFPKQDSTFKSSEESTLLKQEGTPKLSEEVSLPNEEDTSKSSEGSNLPNEEDTSKSSEESNLPNQEDTLKSSKDSNLLKQEDTLKLSKEIVQSTESNIFKKKDSDTFLDSRQANVREILSKEDFQLALREAGEKLVAVDFSAQWCGPCRLMKPLFHALSVKHDDVVFLEVDVDHCEELAQEEAIFAIPAFRFYKNEQMVEEFGGAVKDKLESTIEKLK
ncbi:thioredoxin domain-containing protein 2 [Suncus etruscus]|uniref:thioredoxin domain-containing protein 2 n=1 Tax=Suncus etruscus TaxID=109475 RepID=UPI0021106DF0|nr:thioredoxin domain-containing protein 2 [Suncus etruscus]